tara:strand:- start:18 stop:1166 length:1149 start_codon:yes stop_codon:yes gene_type:complete
MKKICYWSPHISNVATIKNVINSAISLKKFKKDKIRVKILDVIGEWEQFKDLLSTNKIEILKFSNLNLKKFLPISGFFKSRLIYLLVFFFKANQLKKILKSEKPDFLIIHLITIVPLFLLIFYNFDTKFILRISGLPKFTLFRKLLWRMASKKIYLVTCPSQQTNNDLIKYGIFSKDKIKILYDPLLDINKISKKIKEKNIFEMKTPYFVNIGRLTKQKNQILLIKAFSEILKNNKNLNLYIIGDGENKKNLAKYIQSNNLQNNIFLSGHVKNVYPIIRNSLALISTSLWEDPGAVMIEASYCNKNVISSRCPNGPEEFLSFGKGGYLFKNNDKEDLVNKIFMFLNDSEKKKYEKIILCKKRLKNYTLYNHYKSFKLFLNLN